MAFTPSSDEIDQNLLSPSGKGPASWSGDADELNDDDLLEMIIARVTDLWESQPEYLMSMLYRLDVEESKIIHALHPASEGPPYVRLAQLILERQQQRWATKRSIVVPPLGAEWDL